MCETKRDLESIIPKEPQDLSCQKGLMISYQDVSYGPKMCQPKRFKDLLLKKRASPCHTKTWPKEPYDPSYQKGPRMSHQKGPRMSYQKGHDIIPKGLMICQRKVPKDVIPKEPQHVIPKGTQHVILKRSQDLSY